MPTSVNEVGLAQQVVQGKGQAGAESKQAWSKSAPVLSCVKK